MNKHYCEIYFFNVKVLMRHQPLFFVGFLFLIEYNKLFQAFISDACVCSLSFFVRTFGEKNRHKKTNVYFWCSKVAF